MAARVHVGAISSTVGEYPASLVIQQRVATGFHDMAFYDFAGGIDDEIHDDRSFPVIQASFERIVLLRKEAPEITVLQCTRRCRRWMAGQHCKREERNKHHVVLN